MPLRRIAITFAVIVSLVLGGTAAVSTRGPSRPPRAQSLPERQLRAENASLSVQDEAAVAAYHRVQVRALVRWANESALTGFAWKVGAVAKAIRAQQEAAAAAAAAAQAQAAAPVRHHRSTTSQQSTGTVGGRGTCVLNGHLYYLDCRRLNRESHGDYTADNPNSSAYGAYQIMGMPPGTPPAEQDRIAQTMASCNWDPPHYCAG